jgi:hypothetical protein
MRRYELFHHNRHRSFMTGDRLYKQAVPFVFESLNANHAKGETGDWAFWMGRSLVTSSRYVLIGNVQNIANIRSGAYRPNCQSSLL